VEHIIHLNNAGASLQPEAVTDTVIEYLRLEAERGGYEAAELRSTQIEATYSSVAQLIGARPDEIALTGNATLGWDMAFYGMHFSPGDRVITCSSEYGSNAIAYLHRAKRHGIEIVVIPNDVDGTLDLDMLEKELAVPRTKLVSMNHVPTQSGVVNPAAKVGALARTAGVLFLLDACQSVGQLDLDVSDLQCDILTGTGRKYIRGPRGTGFLYVNSSAMDRVEPAFLDNRSATWTAPDSFEMRPDARRFETWEKSYGLVVGLGAAVDYALNLGTLRIEERVRELGSYLREGLRNSAGVVVTDSGRDLCGIVTFTVEGLGAAEIKPLLSQSGINGSVSRVTSSQWDLHARGLAEVFRASVHYFNTIDELDRTIEVIQRIASDA
jgi:selenocysteine lyase/cysteine desulfurase